MIILSKKIQDADRRAQALLADLIPLVHDEDIARDPEFIVLLERALHQAQSRLAGAQTQTDDLNGARPKESPEKPHETATP
ncbi:MAG: hypothetical protein ACRD1Z_21295 [Vicinamibacteria bacterium]